ncbi:hypothetical protein M1373_03795 [Candidatus Marsarchaeota archaeon]|nr:hypothetical protein [Candidatus Marsarchaeota archaeon]MCL5405042.1 hypothetical protein [Candidatus Marsarchaeota archaeon]
MKAARNLKPVANARASTIILLTGIAAILVMLLVGGRLAVDHDLPRFDTQQGLTLAGNLSALEYNVTPLNQSNIYGIGQGYLLNGLSNTGYWYQFGISYNWPLHANSHGNGFKIMSEVFYPNASSMNPNGVVLNSINISSGNIVLLKMYFSGGNVVMSVYDWNTSFEKSISYPAYNATYFVGGPYRNGINNGTSDKSGEFTGLMTEQYYDSGVVEKSKQVSYTAYNGIVYNAAIWYHAGWTAAARPPAFFAVFGCTFNSRCSYDFSKSGSFVDPANRTYALIFGNVSESLYGSRFNT